MRDNVNTNYGTRADLVKLLQDSGAKNLLTKIAGQSLKSFEPRGLARVTAGLGTIATGAGAALLIRCRYCPLRACWLLSRLASWSES
jgi:hypothetical protein